MAGKSFCVIPALILDSVSGRGKQEGACPRANLIVLRGPQQQNATDSLEVFRTYILDRVSEIDAKGNRTSFVPAAEGL
jgi:hypothetical protein